LPEYSSHFFWDLNKILCILAVGTIAKSHQPRWTTPNWVIISIQLSEMLYTNSQDVLLHTIIYLCFALLQLLCRCQNQSRKLWISPRMCPLNVIKEITCTSTFHLTKWAVCVHCWAVVTTTIAWAWNWNNKHSPAAFQIFFQLTVFRDLSSNGSSYF
jgi:hypothetical protein